MIKKIAALLSGSCPFVRQRDVFDVKHAKPLLFHKKNELSHGQVHDDFPQHTGQ